MGMTAANVVTMKKKVAGLRADLSVKKFLIEFIEAMSVMDNASSDQTAGDSGSVTAGASSEALTVKDGLITNIA
jgi:hypothetical protein